MQSIKIYSQDSQIGKCAMFIMKKEKIYTKKGINQESIRSLG